MDASEAELKEFNSEITLEKREMWKCGSEMDRKKARMKETKVELNKQQKTGEKLKNDVNGLKDTKISCNNRALTAEEKANQMQRYWIFFLFIDNSMSSVVEYQVREQKMGRFLFKSDQV